MSLPIVTHLSPIIGVDGHTVTTTPSPLPHPHVGIVLDFNEMVNAANSAIGSIVMNFVQENVPEDLLEKAGQVQQVANLANSLMKGDFKSAASQVGSAVWNSKTVQNDPLVKKAVELKNNAMSALGGAEGGASDRPVLVGNILRATIGTNSYHIPGLHFPLGAGFAQKLPSNDTESFMGSKTVRANGDMVSCLGFPALSCWIVGKPPDENKNSTHGKRREVSIPSAIPLPIPMGRPVVVGGPPMVNVLTVATALFKAFRGSALAQKLFKNFPDGFIKCAIFDAEPVNSITGEVVVQQNDFTVEGRLPLIWDRYYSGQQFYHGAIGEIWLSPADSYLSLVVHEGLLGAIIQFPDHKTAVEVLPAFEGWEHRSYDWQQGHAIYRIKNTLILRTRTNIEYHYALPQCWQQKIEQLKENKEIKLHFSHMQDLNGNGWRFERDGTNRLSRIVEFTHQGETGRFIICSHHGEYLANLTLYPDSKAREGCLLVGYRQNEQGDLVSVIDTLNQPYCFEYRDDHQIIRHNDRNGLSFYYDYKKHGDGISRVFRAWGDHGLFDYRFAYYPERQETLITDSLGNTTTLQYDERQYPIVRIDPLGGVKSYQYDAQDRGCSEIDPAGNKTEWHYDERANIVKYVYPDNSSTNITYNKLNCATIISDRDDKSWLQEWNDKGQLIYQKTPLGRQNYFRYDDLGQLTQVIYGEQKNELAYDNFGFLTQLTDNLGRSTYFENNWRGHCISKTLANGDTTHYYYDDKQRLTACQLADKQFIRCRYDHEDNLIEYKDQAEKVTQFAYFGQGRLAQQVSPDGSSIDYHYDTEENLIGVTNQRGETWYLKRDAVGQLIEEIDYWGKSRHYQYNDAGYLTESRNPLGQIFTIECNKLGQIIRKVPTGLPESSEEFSYNKRGQLTLAKNKCSEVIRKYNAEGMLTEEHQKQHKATGKLIYQYNDLGQLEMQCTSFYCHQQKEEQAFVQQQRFVYNELGQLISQQIDEHEPILFEFDDIGRLKCQKQTAEMHLHFEYTKTGQLKQQHLKNGNERSDKIEYHYDEVGNLVMRYDSLLGKDTYHYDVLGQIISHTNPLGEIQHYVYDACGNRFVTEIRADGGRDLIFNQNTRYRLNEAGQIITKTKGDKQQHFIWDENECLSETHIKEGKTVYEYDALRRRINKTHYNASGKKKQTTYFIWDGDVLASEITQYSFTKEEEKLDARFFIYYLNTFEPLILQCKRQGIGSLAPPEETGYYFYQNDPNGMPLRLRDEESNIVWFAQYDIFAKTINLKAIQITQPLRLQGQYFDDESGLHYNRHRYYDPETGIFISQDPIGLVGGLNVYQYAPNTLGWIDPLGLSCDDVEIDDKIRDQLDDRGWTEEDVQDITKGPVTGTSTDKRKPNKTADGLGRDDTASVYGPKDGYVVVNDRTKEVVQISDRTDPGWIPDGRIVWNENSE